MRTVVQVANSFLIKLSSITKIHFFRMLNKKLKTAPHQEVISYISIKVLPTDFRKEDLYFKLNFKFCIYVCMHRRIYKIWLSKKTMSKALAKKFASLIYISYSFWAKVFRFHIESWPEWDSNPRPRTYLAHAPTTELSGRTMKCA